MIGSPIDPTVYNEFPLNKEMLLFINEDDFLKMLENDESATKEIQPTSAPLTKNKSKLF